MVKKAHLASSLVYNTAMSDKTILKANPYLRNPDQRKEMLFQSIASSSAIEGVRIIPRTSTGRKTAVKATYSKAGKLEK